jgi:dolichol-phosphate mannosyltransferase
VPGRRYHLEYAEDTVDLSVVVPVYGCADCLDALWDRLTRAVREVTAAYELIFVDDRSRDDAWPKLQQLASKDKHVRAFRLSRNFGQHAAITAGLAQSRGERAVVMDCDLQDPPELIPLLHSRALEGFDVVMARRTGRRSTWRRFASRAYSKLMKTFLGTEMSGDIANLSVISRKVINAFLALGDLDRQYILILRWLGFEQSIVDFEQPERFAGRSAYTLPMLVRVAMDGLFFQTTTLLRWIVYVGFLAALAGVALAAVFVLIYLTHSPYPLPGWTSLSVLVLLMGGFIILSTGVTGLYIGKIFQQVKGRPLYVIDEVTAQMRAAEEPVGQRRTR